MPSGVACCSARRQKAATISWNCERNNNGGVWPRRKKDSRTSGSEATISTSFQATRMKPISKDSATLGTQLQALALPSVSDPGNERRLAAIVFADHVGYSRLMAADEAGTHGRWSAL